MANKVLGHHLLLQLMGCDSQIMEDEKTIREALLSCAALAESTVVADVFHRFSPHGITGVVVIEESHISVHTWPEHKSIVIDFFTCNLNADFVKVVAHLKSIFRAEVVVSEIIKRKIKISAKFSHVG